MMENRLISVFDKIKIVIERVRSMKHISVLIKPASSLCNIKCKYCFYNDLSSIREVTSFGKMTKELGRIMIDRIYEDLVDGDRLSLAFQGGEPTVAGLSFYRFLTEYIKSKDKQVKVDYSIQTNGLLINEKWCELFKEHHFLVGLSMDGPASFHDLARVDWRQKGTFNRVQEAKRLFDIYGIEYNILTVLTNKMALEPDKVIQFLLDEQINYIQFIPCMDSLESKNTHQYGLTPKEFAFFYKEIYQFWFDMLKEGKYVSIKLFDDLFHLLVNAQITACGISGSCQTQYVIEGDGSVYPCDFYVLDDYCLGNIKEKTLKELFEEPINIEFLCEKRAAFDMCQKCPYQRVCGGGCKRMEQVIYVNSEDNYCGFKEVLDIYSEDLSEIVSYVRSLNK